MPRRRKSRSARPRPCELCEQLATVRYRIQHDESQTWRLTCLDCQEKCSKNNPHYRYGGTWKAR